MSKIIWKQGDEAHIVIRKPGDCLHTVLRQVTLVANIYDSIWRVKFDEIDDGADITGMDIAIEENRLYKTSEEAIQAYVAEIVTDLLNENQEWYQETHEND